MASLNSVSLIGNLGADPELRHSQGGTAVVNFNLATSESYKTKAGEKVEKTEWHKVVAFGKLAEIIAEYARKGTKVFVRGQLQTDKYDDKEGITRYVTKVVIGFKGEFILLSSKNAGGPSRDKSAEPAITAEAMFSGGGPTDDDDIPF